MVERHQSVGHRRDGHAGDVHGGAGHQRGQRVAAAHRREPVVEHGRSHLGADVVPGGQRHHPADGRVVFHAARAQAVLHDLRGAVHRQLVSVRFGSVAGGADVLPGIAGGGRRSAAARLAGHSGGELPARKTRHGDGHLRHGRGGGPGDRAHSGRLDHGQLLLALDFLHQYTDGSCCR
jgi:hypothetical protein